jgi:hypothetical protein
MIDFDRAREVAHQCLDFAWRLYLAGLARYEGGLSRAAFSSYFDTVEAAAELCELASRVITSELLDALCKVSAGDRPPHFRLGSVTAATAHGLAFRFLAVLWEELQYPPQRPVVNAASNGAAGLAEVEAGFSELEQRAEAVLHDHSLLRAAVMGTKINEAEIETLSARIDREWGSAKAADMPRQTGGPGWMPPQPDAPSDIAREAALRQLKPADRKANFSFLYAEGKVSKRLEDHEAHGWLKENGIDTDKGDLGELTNYQLRAFPTWSRQLRNARNALGEQKYTRRAGRTAGRSIVSGREIEQQRTDDE